MNKVGRIRMIILILAGCGYLLWLCPGIYSFSSRETGSYTTVRDQFENPPMKYAPYMLQFWDTLPTPEQSAEVARTLLQQGFNPGTIYPYSPSPNNLCGPNRPLLNKSDYLSPQWFAAVDAMVCEAEKQGGYVGFNMENNWPIGLAFEKEILEKYPDLRATSIRCEKQTLHQGQTVSLNNQFFATAAQLVPEDPTLPSAPQLGRWIWHPHAPKNQREVFFRKQIDLPADRTLKRAAIQITADNQYELYLDGRKIGEDKDHCVTEVVDLTGHLQQAGPHLLAIKVIDLGSPGGLKAGVRLDFDSGDPLQFLTDSSWKCILSVAGEWTKFDGSDADWVDAQELDPAMGGEGWKITEASSQRRILSSTLQIIAADQPTVWTAPEGEWRVFVFTTYFKPGDQGGTLNYLDRRIVPNLIERNLVPYEKYFGDRLKQGTLAFTLIDAEQDYGDKIAWSKDLEETYQATKGLSLRQQLPLLFDEDQEGQWVKARWDYIDAVSEVFADGLFGELAKWAAQYDLGYQIQDYEENLQIQVSSCADFFRMNRHATLPGNDAVGDVALRVHDFKEVGSIAEFEHRQHFTEMLAALGWHLTPDLMKRCTNGAIAWGVSFLELHVLYMNRDLLSIPYPPDLYTENPYWRYLHLLTAFSKRACWVNAMTRQTPQTLMYWPFDSAAGLTVNGLSGFDPRVAEINKVYSDAMTLLARHNVSFHIADNSYLREAELKPGVISIAGLEFQSLILPPVEILPLDIAHRMVAFVLEGGNLFALGSLARGSTEHGMNDPQMNSLMNELQSLPTFHACPGGMEEALSLNHPALSPFLKILPSTEARDGENPLGTAPLSPRETTPLPAAHRQLEGHDFFWLANNDSQISSGTVEFQNVKGLATLWDCEQGTISDLVSRETPNGSQVFLRFEPSQAYWVVFDPSLPARKHQSGALPAASPKKILTLEGPWKIGIDPAIQPPVQAPHPLPENFVIDDASGTIRIPLDTGIERPLESWTAWGLETFTGLVDYTHDFELERIAGQILLDLGQVRYMAEVWVNGKEVGARLWSPFCFDLTAHVQPGKNTVKVRVGNLYCNAQKQNELAGTVHRGPWYPVTPPEYYQSGLLGPVQLILVNRH